MSDLQKIISELEVLAKRHLSEGHYKVAALLCTALAELKLAQQEQA